MSNDWRFVQQQVYQVKVKGFWTKAGRTDSTALSPWMASRTGWREQNF